MENPAPTVVLSGALPLKELASTVLSKVLYKLFCKATPSTVELLRNYMENQGEPLRVKCIQKLNKAGEGNRQSPTNVCAFLDAILDVNIVDKLKIIVPYQSNFQSYSQLFSIIAHRCPKLKSLSMGFYNASSPGTLVSRLQHHSNLSQLVHRLNYLETLDLWHIHDPPCRCTTYSGFVTNSDASILAIVAEFCPVLINLAVTWLSSSGLTPTSCSLSMTTAGTANRS